MRVAVLEDNNRFLELATLVTAMYKAHNKVHTEFVAVASLMENVKQTDFTCIGLFDDEDKLVGFTIGYYFSKNKFYFSGIYAIMKNNGWTKKLIDFSFAFIKDKGYTSWLVDATNPNISSIMTKYDAQVNYVQYEGKL